MTAQDQRNTVENERESGGGIGKALGIAVSVVTLLGFFGVAKFTDLFTSRQTGSPTTTFSPSTANSTAAAPDRASYISSADAVCRKWFEETARVANTMPDGLERMTTTLNILDNMLTEWQAITPPASDGAEVDSIIQGGRRASEAMHDAELALRRMDRESAVRFIERASQMDEANQQRARAYGFRICG